jgi:hypothetical protein
MPTYVFRLQDGKDLPDRTELVEASDDEEARDLADLRIRLSGEFSSVLVSRGGDDVILVTR